MHILWTMLLELLPWTSLWLLFYQTIILYHFWVQVAFYVGAIYIKYYGLTFYELNRMNPLCMGISIVSKDLFSLFNLKLVVKIYESSIKLFTFPTFIILLSEISEILQKTETEGRPSTLLHAGSFVGSFTPSKLSRNS